MKFSGCFIIFAVLLLHFTENASYVAVIALLLYVGCYQVRSHCLLHTLFENSDDLFAGLCEIKNGLRCTEI
jgi:hypothetical protein